MLTSPRLLNRELVFAQPIQLEGWSTTNGGMCPVDRRRTAFSCGGFHRGLHLARNFFAAQSVVCYYALCRRCRRGEQGPLKRQENRDVIAWRGAASTGLVSSADRA